MKKFNLKFYAIFLITILIFTTAFLCHKGTKLHKPVVLKVIDYFVKINPDNTKTIIEKSTTFEHAKGN